MQSNINSQAGTNLQLDNNIFTPLLNQIYPSHSISIQQNSNNNRSRGTIIAISGMNIEALGSILNPFGNLGGISNGSHSDSFLTRILAQLSRSENILTPVTQ